MPPSKSSPETLIASWIKDNSHLKYEEHVLKCTACGVTIKTKSKAFVTKHVNSKAHQDKIGGKVFKEEFWFDLAVMIICTNLPWNILNNSHFCTFINKYCPDQRLPSESELRRVYLNKVYHKKLEQLRNHLQSGPFCASMDETTDSTGKKIAHLFLKKIYENKPSSWHLINSKCLNNITAQDMTDFFIDSLMSFWSNSAEENFKDIVILTTDSVNYMINAGKQIKQMCPKMLHIMCTAHGILRVCETIRKHFPLVNDLISSTEKIFSKVPSRVKLFHEMLPNTLLPPEPVITGRGSWVTAALYYADHFDNVKMVIDALPAESYTITTAKRLFEENGIKHQLDFIKYNYSYLVLATEKLQNSNIPLTELFKILDKVVLDINSGTGMVATSVQYKLQVVWKRNYELDVIRDINNKMEMSSQELFLWQDIPFSYFKYVPLTSVDCERCFSTCKRNFNTRRNKLSTENLEKILFIYFESQQPFTE